LIVSWRALVGRAGFVWAAEPAEHFGAGGVVEVVAVERPGQGVELGEGGLGSGGIAQRNGAAVQASDRQGSQHEQHVVEEQDLLPVGLRPGLGFSVAGHDGGLELVRARSLLSGGPSEQLGCALDRRVVPPGSLLVLQ
jgi:hypothetical protein